MSLSQHIASAAARPLPAYCTHLSGKPWSRYLSPSHAATCLKDSMGQGSAWWVHDGGELFGRALIPLAAVALIIFIAYRIKRWRRGSFAGPRNAWT